jgi:hypothetical protein
MTDSRRKNLEVTAELERLSNQLLTLQNQVSSLPDRSAHSQIASPETAALRRSLLRARNAFRRLGNGSFALSGFTFVAFLAALIDGKLTLVPAFIIVTAGLFLGLVGLLFHLQADSIDPGETNA